MTVRFKGKAVPFQVWKCENCGSMDRAKRPDGLPSNYCVECEKKFLAAINSYRSKKDPMWFLKSRRAK